MIKLLRLLLCCCLLSRPVLAELSQSDYVDLVHSNHNQLLWLNQHGVNLPGMALTSLLADLGIRQSALLSNEELAQPLYTDWLLTQQLLQTDNIVIGHQVEQDAINLQSLHSAIETGKLTALVESVLPAFPEVNHLRNAIAGMRRIEALPWPKLDGIEPPKLGQENDNVSQIKQVLMLLGDLPANKQNLQRRKIFDPQTIEAIKGFQYRHGLTPNGRLNQETLSTLSVPPAEKLVVMQQNLWRWLSLPSLPPEKYILVNLAEYQLKLVNKNRTQLTMRVVVGKPDSATPVMLTQIDRVTINPPWLPPLNIAREELFPMIQEEPKQLSAQGFRWQPRNSGELLEITQLSPQQSAGQFRLIQLPGEHNALGKFRFNITNHDAIYLHDTPAKSFFNREERALSHGCIRLQHPQLLANALLADEPEQIQQKYKQALADQETTHFRLSKAIPTYLNYQTVVANASGKVFWKKDIYQLDSPPEAGFHQPLLARH